MVRQLRHEVNMSPVCFKRTQYGRSEFDIFYEVPIEKGGGAFSAILSSFSAKTSWLSFASEFGSGRASKYHLSPSAELGE